MSSGGKTAPKLVNDFLAFDPLKVQGGNILTELSPPVGEGAQLSAGNGCKHEYTIKWQQSISPALDERPQQGSQYKAAVICKKCRLHADIHISYHNTSPEGACPKSEYPLHHFLRRKEEDEVVSNRIVYAWNCSAPECQAHLRTTFKLPRLSKNDIHQLNDSALLQNRYDATCQAHPAREGLKLATPLDALLRLRRYLKDALNPEHKKRTFPANNKRFMETFGIDGQDCAGLLQNLGFTFQPGGVSDDGIILDAAWTLPDPAEVPDRLQADGQSYREVLEDVEAELTAWTYEVSARLNLPNPASTDGWPSADRDIERLLAAQGYKRRSSSARRAWTSNEELPYLASLGAQPDFADELVIFAFDRQYECQPSAGSYYLECLQNIAAARSSEDLQIKVATLESQDLVSRRDLTNSFKLLGCTPSDNDDRILSIFHARQSDAGPSGQEDLRQALYRIGAMRQSQRLINASRQNIDTYEDALMWLGNGADKSMDDDALLAIVATKCADQESNSEMAKKAISVIAKERKSNVLNNWVLGTDNEPQMGVEEALRLLGVSESFASLDKDVLPTLLQQARSDRPGEQTDKAIAVLEEAMQCWTSHSSDTWPVGLTSHGNTCYLNSLLQYYFSIKPLREIILDYDRYKLDTQKYTEKEERVGQRKISMVEIKGGQRFAEDLKFLFERMIKDPREHFKPEEDLVCRAFLEPKDFALLASSIREEQAASNARPNGTTLDTAVDEKMSDEPMSQDTISNDQSHNDPVVHETITAALMDTRHPSDTSSITLIGDENDVSMKDAAPLDPSPPTPPASPGSQEKKDDAPPPLPPRRFSTAKEQALIIAQQNARSQQDVTEVHDGIMFRLRSGMMPKGVDEGGEQQDDLRALFSIGLTDTTVTNGVDGNQKDLSDSSIQLNVPTEPTDVYSALDAVFDLQSIGGAIETYKTIRRLPPLLQINIPRIGFSEARGGAYKSEVTVKLEDELYLDRYTDVRQSDLLPRRKACWGWRKRLQQLRQEQTALTKTAIDLDGPTAVNETANYLNTVAAMDEELEELGIGRIEVPGELSFALTCDAAEQSQRLVQLRTEIDDVSKQLDGQFDEMKDIKYCLAAVFIHRGTHGHGHYWTYIKDFGKGIWRKYNDEKVEEYSSVSDILEAKTWEHGTPTYAVYVQDEVKLDFIQPVCRAPEALPVIEVAEPTEMTEPIEMTDATELQPTTFTEPGSRKELLDTRPESPTLGVEGGDKTWDESRQVGADAKW